MKAKASIINLNRVRYYILISALSSLVACGGGSSSDTSHNKPNIPQGTTSLGVLSNGSIVYVSKADFQVSPTGSTNGIIGITSGTTGQANYIGTVSFNTGLYSSSYHSSNILAAKQIVATNITPTITTLPNPCVLNSAQPQKVCAIKIDGNSASTATYTVTPTITSLQQIKDVLSDFLITVTNNPSDKHLSLTKIDHLPQGKRALLTATANGSLNGQSPIIVNFSSSNNAAMHLSVTQCTINLSTANYCSVFVTAGEEINASSNVSIAADGYTGATESITINPMFFYTLNNNLGTISEFNLQPSTGIVTPIGTYPTITGDVTAAKYITNGPFGKFIYALIAPGQTGYVYGLSVNPTTGKLTAIESQPYKLTDQSGNTVSPQTMVIAPSGKFAYIAGTNTSLPQQSFILIYVRSTTTGKLTKLVKAMPITGNPNDMVLDKSGQFLYSIAGATIYMYSIDPTTGLLHPLSPQSITIPDYPNLYDIDTTINHSVYVSAQNTSGGSSLIYMYNIDTHGILKPIENDVPSIATNGTPTKITFNQLGYLYGINTQGAPMNLYTATGNGMLSPIESQPAFSVASPSDIKSSPLGKFVLVLDGNHSKVIEYQVQTAQGGTLDLRESAVTGSNPIRLTFN